MVGEGHEDLSFARALEEEEERSRDRENEYYGRVRFQYYGSGLYAHQLKTYYKYFAPDKFLVLFFEDLRSNHEDVVRSVYRFLRISDDVEIVKPKTFNSAGRPKLAALQSLLRRPNRVKKEIGRIIPFKVKYKMVELLLRWNRKSIQYPPMAPEIKAELRARFRDDVIELEEIIGRELPNWKSV
jgi:hypothetical protein